MQFTTAAGLLLALSAAANAWTMAIYDTTDCAQDTTSYYSLEGDATSEGSAGCISLPNTIPGDVSYCGWFTNGGSTGPGACSSGTFTRPSSFNLRSGGQCAVYNGEGCSGTVSSITANSCGFANSGNWGSMKCWNV
ncbi:hypothetical protein AC578_2605 [Pseudocercospora eumusae]|uniref:Secreted LysM effector LysM C-terminal domain-containing protein n=1 Tax=Pseudocercospora eumusae TaxID=321146 RepID=A0A139H7Q0_9PEZI|nr:hypothetical protein AC578_2605 [Pseudocercospora eumusae]